MTKIFLSLLLIALLASPAHAQCPNPLIFNFATHGDISTIMELNIVTDFCATGDGITNDAAAFLAASAFINARKGYCRLIIPQGTYIVGKQAPTANRYLSTKDVIFLNDVRQVEITGQNKPMLKYEGSGALKYGYFNSDGSPKMFNSAPPFNSSPQPIYAADLGCMIRIYESRGIKISDLVLNGNLYPGEVVIGGYDAGNFNGIQEDYSGVGVWYSDSVEMRHVTAERMGLDGFYIYNTRDDGSGYNHKSVLMQDCVSDFNGRQGISIIGGEYITINSSQFSNVGMGEIQFSGLQAGVDIEPENPLHSVKNVTFNSCQFLKCRNAGVIVSAGTDAVRKIYFNKCIIDNLGGPGYNNALSLGRHHEVKFTDCLLYGYVTIDASNAISFDDGYAFKRCLFSDCNHDVVRWTNPGNPSDEHCAYIRKPMVLTSSVLIYSFSSWDYVSMDSCVFDIYSKRPWYFVNATSGVPSTISNSTIYVNGQTGIDFPVSTAGNNVLQDNGVTLTNNKFYLYNNQDYLHNGTIISGTTPLNSTTTWMTNTFFRWSAILKANVCADTLPCATPWSGSKASAGSLSGLLNEEISIYPNPTDGKLRLDLGEQISNGEITIMSSEGRVLFRQKYASRYMELDISRVPAGMYILRVTTARGTVTKKLVKK